MTHHRPMSKFSSRANTHIIVVRPHHAAVRWTDLGSEARIFPYCLPPTWVMLVAVRLSIPVSRVSPGLRPNIASPSRATSRIGLTRAIQVEAEAEIDPVTRQRDRRIAENRAEHRVHPWLSL